MISFGRRFAMFVVILGLTSRVAQAGETITILQDGLNVVATGSGTIDTTDLGTTLGPFSVGAEMTPVSAAIVEGSTTAAAMDQFAVTTFPTEFGTGLHVAASSGSGDQFGVDASIIFLPAGYVSGNPLNATDTYANTTLSGLGLTPGTYTWTWGTGTHADSITVQIGPAAVPEPSTAILAVSGAVAFVTYSWTRRRRHQRRQVSA